MLPSYKFQGSGEREKIVILLFSDHILGSLSYTAISSCIWPPAAAIPNGNCSAITKRHTTARLLTRDVGSGVGVSTR